MRTGLNGLQERQRKHSPADMAVIQRYGDGRRFAETFNPDLQKVCAQNVERSFAGDAPTIATAMSAYNIEQVRVWILAQIENLNQFAGTKNKMNPGQMTMLSDIIITEYYYLKASELLLFFFQFKSGKYGELYGSVDPLRITSALVEFASYRRGMISKIEDEKRRKESEKSEREKVAITRREYRMRKLAKSGKTWKIKRNESGNK